MPAPSLPGVYGSEGLITWPPARMRVSTGLTPADLTRTNNWTVCHQQKSATLGPTVCKSNVKHTHTNTSMHACTDAHTHTHTHTRTHTHTHLTALCSGLPGWAGTIKVKPIWILLKQETVSGSGISWDICKSAPRSRQITTLAPHHSVFYRLDALPVAQPTVSKHWRQE